MTDKQIITLSTGVITLTVTFLEKIVPPSSPAMGRTVPWTMFVAWVAFGAAIQAAIVTLGAVTGTMDAIDRKANGPSTNSQQDLAVTSRLLRSPLVRSLQSRPGSFYCLDKSVAEAVPVPTAD